MSTRVNISKTAPDAYKAFVGVENYIASTALTTTHKELIKIRASQINGCAFCINMHTADARKYGETEQRIYMLNAWREADIYTEEEKAILALTEQITLISNHHGLEEAYARMKELFDDKYIADVIVMISAINNWNRIAISSGWRVA
ncbi:carboxymuconolactone decarboxylase family protein [Flavobacterium sp. MAH-1]|uniref:Carboxymuconolactone decarboxylase family protein n=1 Tax=Flavobacterium agri TaxID=2743471 RepID=A0A7Y9C8Q3_9FLAO|nr:carboxymuconolactone decarboxylase family protein [Flavobacterium agri]NUY82639.1 carboxymuconolactone decarboxylase family protein [Flavobacterium agri]NYA72662.1 carboxymuconolactone decarboxylase family protein [Flavobacterium agri]